MTLRIENRKEKKIVLTEKANKQQQPKNLLNAKSHHKLKLQMASWGKYMQ